VKTFAELTEAETATAPGMPIYIDTEGHYIVPERGERHIAAALCEEEG